MESIRQFVHQLWRRRPFNHFGKSVIMRPDGVLEDAPFKTTLCQDDWDAADAACESAFKEFAPVTHKLIEDGLVYNLQSKAAQEIPSTTLKRMQANDADDTTQPFFQLDAVALPIASSKKFEKLADARSCADAVCKVIEGAILGTIPAPGVAGLINNPTTIKTKFASLQDMGKYLYDKNMYGPYGLVCGNGLKSRPFHTLSNVMRTNDVESVWFHDGVPDGDLILFQKTEDCVRIIVGCEITPCIWDGAFKVVACIVPQVRGGVVHYSSNHK